MANIVIVLFAALFASAATTDLQPVFEEAIQRNVTDEIDDVISKFKDLIQASEEVTLEVAEVLFDAQVKYITKVADKTKTITQEAEDKIHEFAEKAEGVDIKDCLKLAEGLDEVAADTILLTSECIYNEMLPAREYTEGIEMVCNDVLGNLTATREEVEDCGDDVDCAIAAADLATQIALEGTSDLNIRMFDLKYWSDYFEPAASEDCASEKQTESLEEEASTVINDVQKCIEGKINES